MGFVDTPIDNHYKKCAGPGKGRLIYRGRQNFAAVRPVCLADDIGLRAPAEIDVGYGILANVAAESGCWKTSGRGARSLEWRQVHQLLGVLGMSAGEARQPSLTQ